MKDIRIAKHDDVIIYDSFLCGYEGTGFSNRGSQNVVKPEACRGFYNILWSRG